MEARNIVCPLHRWTYALDGKLLGAPQFAQNPCLDLARSQLTSWNGLLFAGQRSVTADLASLGVANDLDFSGFGFDGSKSRSMHATGRRSSRCI